MENETQLNRYKKLLAYIDKQFKEDIDIKQVEEVCHYSYRNINRIFRALHHETIGKYIKRLRLEKAAQYLKYSELSISDIAFEVGFEDIAAFSKAFKNRYDCSPSAFRNSNVSIRKIMRQSIQPSEGPERQTLSFEIVFLDDFDYLSLEYRGAYDDIPAISAAWEELMRYAEGKNIVDESSIFMTEILDDNEISDSIHCRFNLSLLLKRALPFKPEGLFTTKSHQRQKYAKFVHKGPYTSSQDTYNEIYAFWMVDVNLELEDLPTLEFYVNSEADTPPEDLITEIYIPVR